MARHVHADYWQRSRRLVATDLDGVERSTSHHRAAHAQLSTTTRDQALQEALDLLAPAQREILVLHRFEGFDYAEIGAMLGCSASTARVKAHRALEALRIIYFR